MRPPNELPCSWKTSKLGALPIEMIDGDRSSRYPKREEFVDKGVLFLNTTNIEDNRLTLSQANYISSAKYEEIKKGRVEQFDILMTTRGTIGKVALFQLPIKALINAQMLLLRADGEVLDRRFLFHVLRSDSFQSRLRNFSSGSAQPQIPIIDLKKVEICYPPAPVQRRIANILSAYDDLIENNTRRIKILEEIAQRIYREWFIDFRFPGHQNVRMVEAERGLIPSGWSCKRVTEAVSVNPPTKLLKEGIKSFVPMGAVSETSMLISGTEEREGNSGSKFKNGDTLFARITPCLENGKTGFVQFLPSEESSAFGSTEFIVLRSKTVCPEYVYLMARSNEFRDNAIKSMSGATGRQRVQEACFERFSIAEPDGNLLQRFQDHVSRMFRLIHVLDRTNLNLRATRDLLLPKLISGEIPVEAAEGKEAELLEQSA